MPVLFVEQGLDKGKFRILEERSITVGREADFSLTDRAISKHHFIIEYKKNQYFAGDLRSHNGTEVDENIVQGKLLLKHYSKIKAGKTLLRWSDQLAPNNPIKGIQIDNYTIENYLGQGAMGSVYKVKHQPNTKTYAIKFLTPKFSQTKYDYFIEHFLKEVKATSRLRHPNVIRLFEHGNFFGQHYFTMEYATKGCIQDLVLTQNISIDEKISYFIDIVKGMEYIEKKHLAHCDIKPENLMICSNNVAKISDLGLVKFLKEENKNSDKLFGTPHYVSPEQVLAKEVDHRTDIYSLGASFYYIFSGKHPFEGSSKEILNKKIEQDPPPLKIISPSMPTPLSQIIDKMIRKSRDERYQSNSLILADLMKFREQL